MSRRAPLVVPMSLGVLVSLVLVGCAMPQRTVRSSSLEFLYPKGAEPAAAADVVLKIPVRVGLAFAPTGLSGSTWTEPLAETQRQALLERIASSFRDRESIASLEVIPSTYLAPGGGFDNLDRLKAAFGVDLILLLSYEQTQFNDTTGGSLAYWTIIGAYIVKGEKNETRTMLEAVVYDIPSRALLLRAGGSSESTSRSTPIGAAKSQRVEASAGFETATEDLIANLEAALDAFEAQSRAGTVRGIGTPAISLVDSSGAAPAGGSGAGAFGAIELILLPAFAVACRLAGRRRRDRDA